MRGSEDGEIGSERVRDRLNEGGLLSAGLRESIGTRKADRGDMGVGSVSMDDGVLGAESGAVDITSRVGVRGKEELGKGKRVVGGGGWGMVWECRISERRGGGGYL